MSLSKKSKKQLIVSVSIMALAVVTLIAGVLAWFSTRDEAFINDIELVVERKALDMISEITTIGFPCATKFCEADATEFNQECAVEKTYIFRDLGKLHTTVDCSKGPGMIGYVCNSTSTTDYYNEIYGRLKTELQYSDQEIAGLSFNSLYSAIQRLNDRRVGDDIDGNTHVKIVYWMEYDKVSDTLLSGVYEELEYDAHITFVAA